MYSYIFIGPIFSVLLTFSHKYLHHKVPCSVAYQIKVVILLSIFIKILSQNSFTRHQMRVQFSCFQKTFHSMRPLVIPGYSCYLYTAGHAFYFRHWIHSSLLSVDHVDNDDRVAIDFPLIFHSKSMISAKSIRYPVLCLIRSFSRWDKV